MVKEDISEKQKGIYYPPEIKYFMFDTDPAWGDDEELAGVPFSPTPSHASLAHNNPAKD